MKRIYLLAMFLASIAATPAEARGLDDVLAALEALKYGNADTRLAALTRPGECGLGEVICSHDFEPKQEARGENPIQLAEGPGASPAT